MFLYLKCNSIRKNAEYLSFGQMKALKHVYDMDIYFLLFI
jgi:hypothetical protein